jgi:hypothetical protein
VGREGEVGSGQAMIRALLSIAMVGLSKVRGRPPTGLNRAKPGGVRNVRPPCSQQEIGSDPIRDPTICGLDHVLGPRGSAERERKKLNLLV